MRRIVREALITILLVGGFASLSYGAGLAYRPAGFIVAGILLLSLGLLGEFA
jgi:hypothetical protein